MRYMGHGTLIGLFNHDRPAENNSTPPQTVPPGAYSRANEDKLRDSTGMSLKSLFNKIVSQNPSAPSPSPSSQSGRSLMQRTNSNSAHSSHLRRPSADGTPRSSSHILVSFPIPEDIARAVCELWVRRVEAARCWWLADDIDFDAPNDDALFAVVRLALIDRVREGQFFGVNSPAPDSSGEVSLFSAKEMAMPLLKATAIAKMLTAGDPAKVQVLDQILQRRVVNADYPVQAEEIPRGENLEAWQKTTSAVLRHVFGADGALRNSDLIDALSIAWEQVHILAD